jgi:dihydroflavonol-4-reductase
MKVLITGASGFIGRHVSQLLVARGDRVRATVVPGEDRRWLESQGVETVVCDVRDLAALESAMSGCQAVFHLAAIYALWMRDVRPIYQVNVQGTRNVFDAARSQGVERVVHTSSIAALGVEPGTRKSTEETVFNQHRNANDYVLSKYYAERVAREYIEEGMDVVIVNPAFPVGRGDVRPTPTGRILLRICEGTYFGAHPGGLNIVDVEDVARSQVAALERGRAGGQYLLSGTDITTADFFGKVLAVAGIDRKVRAIPNWLMWVMGQAGDLIGHFTEPMLDSRTVAYTGQYLYYDCSRAREELGHQVTPLDEIVEKSLSWFGENGYFDSSASWRLRPWKLGSRK